MPRYTKQFDRPAYVDHKILNSDDGSVFGTIRIKPVSILWKGTSQRTWKAISIEEFASWIAEHGTESNR